MDVLVVGSGGREHALVWSISRSPYVEKVYCAPGNGGIANIANCIDIEVTNIKGLASFAEKNNIDLTVVGPEFPLTLGIVDYFRGRELSIFGPDKRAAEIEGSKSFAKNLMQKYHIPTAKYQVFTDPNKAIQAINLIRPPLVIKADGLAAGKGVLLCTNKGEAFDGIDKIMKKKVFGDSGNKLIIEEFMEGEEASILAITDGKNIVILPTSQDHKAIFEGDKGPNTGGMGAYSPTPIIGPRMLKTIKEKVLKPTILGMEKEGRPYTGVLYAGLMITKEGPKVLEYNCRFGDPEIQAVLPLLKTDIVDLMMCSCEGRVKEEELTTTTGSSVCVIMASGGYPGSYAKGKLIQGLENIPDDVLVFHAGTQKKGNHLLTSGGRVLGVTAVGDNISDAVDKVYQSIGKITYDGAYYRRDIAHRAIKRKND